MHEPAEFTVPEVFQIVGYLTVAIPELHSVHPGDVSNKLSKAIAIIRDERENERANSED